MIAFIEAYRAGLFQRQHTLAALHEDVRVLIIRLGRVPFIDATAMDTLEEMITRLQKRHTRIMICEANPLVVKKLAQAGITDLLGVENIHANLASARVWLAFNHETIMDS